jgi:hypothetical protein
MQHVVNAVVTACFLNRSDIRGLFYDANQALVARGAAAVDARIDIRDIAANRAEVKIRFHLPDGVGEQFSIFVAGAKDMEGQTLGRLAADSRQLLQFFDEPRHRLCEFRQLVLGILGLPIRIVQAGSGRRAFRPATIAWYCQLCAQLRLPLP